MLNDADTSMPITPLALSDGAEPWSASHRSKLPRFIGKYTVLGPLGSGGMATVMLATTTGAGGIKKLVVLKKIRDDFANDPEFLRMLLGEAQVATRLSHPNVIHVYEVGEDAGTAFITMEYLEGQSLFAIQKKLGLSHDALPLRQHLRILCSVLEGLDYAHQLTDYDGTPLGIVHRDVSPHNVLVTYDGTVKILDFGIAKAVDSGIETRTGVLKGKVAYMAPEQARGEHVDGRADCFAAGVMLWEAVAGRRLWKGLNSTAILGRLLLAQGDIPRPSTISGAADAADLDAICLKALAWNRDERFTSALELKRQIEQWLASRGPVVDARDVADLLTRPFEQEKAERRKVIDDGMKDLSVALDEGPVSNRGAFDVPALAPADVESFDGATATNATQQQRPRRTLGAMTAMAAGAVLVLLVSSRHRFPATAAASTAQEPVPDVALVLKVKPQDATLYIDGKRVEAPYAGRERRDDQRHLVRAEAAGYKPLELDVSFSSDVSLDLDLDPQPMAVSAALVEPPPDARRARGALRPMHPPAAPKPNASSRETASAAAATSAHPKQELDDMMIPRVPKRNDPKIDEAMPW